MSAYLKNYQKGLSKEVKETPEDQANSSHYFRNMVTSNSELKPETAQEESRHLKNPLTKFLATPEERRHALRFNARVGETVAGLGGSIRDAPENLLDTAKFIATGEKPTSESKKRMDLFKKIILPPALQGLPTPEDIRKHVTKPLSGESLEPANNKEAIEDELVQAFTSASIPIGGVAGFLRGVGAVGAGLLAKLGVRELGGSERSEAAAQLGTTVLSGALMQPGTKSLANKLYKDVETSLPKKASIPKAIVEQEFAPVIAKAKKGTQTAADKFALKKMRELLAKSKGGKIEIEELVAAKKKFYKEIGNWESPLETRLGLKQVTPAINKSIEAYGNQNPQWVKKYKQADEVYGALRTGERIGGYINKVIKSSKGSVFSPVLIGLFTHPGTTAIVGGAAYIGSKMAGFVNHLKSPTLRNHYLKVLKAGASENPQAVLSALQEFDEALKEEES